MGEETGHIVPYPVTGKIGLDFCTDIYYYLCTDKRKEEKEVSPRTGRPTEDPKRKRFELRVSEKENEMLEFCMKETGMSRADVIRRGIELVYKEITQK